MIRGERMRAWILIQVESPHDAAQKLYNALWEEGGDGYVVIRADVVTYEPFNLVVPLDVEDSTALDYVLHRIGELITPTQTAILQVSEHFPSVPHDAHGFITQNEYDEGHEKPSFRPGRQHWSPGMNAWG